MIKKLCKNWLIDLKQSFMIGDSQVDKLCAKKSNLYFEYSKTIFITKFIKLLIKFNNYL
jgi:histidinol phosphatase-like enzyme